jgi:hypothetical protein
MPLAIVGCTVAAIRKAKKVAAKHFGVISVGRRCGSQWADVIGTNRSLFVAIEGYRRHVSAAMRNSYLNYIVPEHPRTLGVDISDSNRPIQIQH